MKWVSSGCQNTEKLGDFTSRIGTGNKSERRELSREQGRECGSKR